MDKQIKALEDLITTEYSNITGIVINKTAKIYTKPISTATLLTTPPTSCQ